MTRKLFVASPMRDLQVAGAREFSMVHLALAAGTIRMPGIEILPPLAQYDEDLVRVRSRYVRAALESDCTDVLWIDADMSFAPEAVVGLVASGHDVVAVPYPRKRIDWAALSRAIAAGPRAGVNAEALAYEYPITLLPGRCDVDQRTMTVPIAGIGFGLTLTSRAALERMVTHYRRDPALVFDDDTRDGKRHETVALFQLLNRERALLSEDHSFCQRWRDIGGVVHMYLGPGAPADHVGPHYFRGHLEAFTKPG